MEHTEFKPCMTPAEVALFSECIPHAGCALEFGSGGSTQLFFERGASRLYSIDSDEEWLKKLIASPVVSIHLKYNRWKPFHANIGPVRAWGAPVAEEPQICWLNYHQYCWETILERTFDIILIDGRFRVACLCQSLLRCDNDNATYLFHDFFNRPDYSVVLEFLDVVAQADTLAVFKPKKNINWKKLNLVLQAHQFVFD